MPPRTRVAGGAPRPGADLPASAWRRSRTTGTRRPPSWPTTSTGSSPGSRSPSGRCRRRPRVARWVRRHPAPAALAAWSCSSSSGAGRGHLAPGASWTSRGRTRRPAAEAGASSGRRDAARRPSGWPRPANCSPSGERSDHAGRPTAARVDVGRTGPTWPRGRPRGRRAVDPRRPPGRRGRGPARPRPPPGRPGRPRDDRRGRRGQPGRGGRRARRVQGVGTCRTHCPVRVRLVDPVTGETLRELTFPARGVTTRTGATSRTGCGHSRSPRTASGCSPRTRAGWVHRFDLDSPEKCPARTWKAPVPAEALAVAGGRGGPCSGCAGAQRLVRWDAETGAEAARHAPAGRGPRGRRSTRGPGDVIAADGPGLVRLDPTTLQPRAPATSTAADDARSPAFLPGGRVLVAARARERRGVRPDVAPPDRPVHRPGPARPGGPRRDGDARSPSTRPGRTLATARNTERTVKVWAVGVRPAGRRRSRCPGPARSGWRGPATAGSCWPPPPDQTLRFEFTAPRPSGSPGSTPHPLEAAAFAPDGRRVAALGEFRDPPDPVDPDPVPDRPGRPVRELSVPLAPRPRDSPAGAGRPPEDRGVVVVTRTGTGRPALATAAKRVGDLGLTPGAGVRCPRYSPDGVDGVGGRGLVAGGGVGRGHRGAARGVAQRGAASS